MIDILRNAAALLGFVVVVHFIIVVVSASLMAIINFNNKRYIAKEVLRCTLAEIAKTEKSAATLNVKNTNENEQNTQN